MNKSTPENADSAEKFELPQQASQSALILRGNPARLESAINPHIDKLVSREIDFGIGLLQESFVAIAESCHLQYRRNEVDRMRKLRDIYDQLGRPTDVVVLLYCKNFFPLFENWLASCEKHNISVKHKVIAFTLDEESTQKTSALGVKSYFLDPEFYMKAGESAAFGDREFARTMFYKNAIVKDVLELGANVLFQDVDMLWLRDPFEYFSANCNDHDIYFMFDGANPFHRPLYANSGFIYIRCNDACKALFETAMRNSATIFQCRSHQKPLNQILAYFSNHNVLAIKVLPQTAFMNGHLFNLDNGVRDVATNWKADGYVVHYSWTANREEKQQKIRKFGFNYLPGTQLFDSLNV